MYFVNTLRTTTLKHLGDLAEIDKELEAYNREKGNFSDEYFKARIAPLKSKRSDIVDAGKRAVKDLLEQYRDDVIARYTPNGDELTQDRIAAAENLALCAEGALDDQWRALLFTDDTCFDKIQPDAIRGE